MQLGLQVPQDLSRLLQATLAARKRACLLGISTISPMTITSKFLKPVKIKMAAVDNGDVLLGPFRVAFPVKIDCSLHHPLNLWRN